jgi:serine/threonine protein kinase
LNTFPEKVMQLSSNSARCLFKRKAHLLLLAWRYIQQFPTSSNVRRTSNDIDLDQLYDKEKRRTSYVAVVNFIETDDDFPSEKSSSSCSASSAESSNGKTVKRKIDSDDCEIKSDNEKDSFEQAKRFKRPSQQSKRSSRQFQRRRSSQFYIFINSNFDVNVLQENDAEQFAAEDGETSDVESSHSKSDLVPDLIRLVELDALDDQQAEHLIRSATIGKGSFGRVLRSQVNGQRLAIKVTVFEQEGCECDGEHNGLRLDQHRNVAQTRHIIRLRSACETFQTHAWTLDDLPFGHYNEWTVSERTQILWRQLLGSTLHSMLTADVQLVLMELAGDCSLQQLLDDHTRQRIDKRRRYALLQQICAALEHLKRNRIAHLDLKPANVMVNCSTNLVKLIDFGSSREMSDHVACDAHSPTHESSTGSRMFSFANPFAFHHSPASSPATSPTWLSVDPLLSLTSGNYSDCLSISSTINRDCNQLGSRSCAFCSQSRKTDIGTVPYTAPEIFRCDVTNYFQADVFSLGITLWQIVTRKVPYHGENMHSIIYRVIMRFVVCLILILIKLFCLFAH